MVSGVIDRVPPLGELSLGRGSCVMILMSRVILWFFSGLTWVSTAKEALMMSPSLLARETAPFLCRLTFIWQEISGRGRCDCMLLERRDLSHVAGDRWKLADTDSIGFASWSCQAQNRHPAAQPVLSQEWRGEQWFWGNPPVLLWTWAGFLGRWWGPSRKVGRNWFTYPSTSFPFGVQILAPRLCPPILAPV